MRPGSDPGAHAAELTLSAGAEGEHLGLGRRLAVAPEAAGQHDEVAVTRRHGLDRGGVRWGSGSGDGRHAVLPPRVARREPELSVILEHAAPKNRAIVEECEGGRIRRLGVDNLGALARRGQGHLPGYRGCLVVPLGDYTTELSLLMRAPGINVALDGDGDGVQAARDHDLALGKQARVSARVFSIDLRDGERALAGAHVRRQAQHLAGVVTPHVRVAIGHFQREILGKAERSRRRWATDSPVVARASVSNARVLLNANPRER